MWHRPEIVQAVRTIIQMLPIYYHDQAERDAALDDVLQNLKDTIMALDANVQALVDAAHANKKAIDAVTASLKDVATKLAALQSQQANVPGISPDDVAAIQSATAEIQSGVSEAQDALAPVAAAAPAVADAATQVAADPAPAAAAAADAPAAPAAPGA